MNPYHIINDLLDHARELRGEWAWKRNSTDANNRDMAELDQHIAEAEAALLGRPMIPLVTYPLRVDENPAMTQEHAEAFRGQRCADPLGRAVTEALYPESLEA